MLKIPWIRIVIRVSTIIERFVASKASDPSENSLISINNFLSHPATKSKRQRHGLLGAGNNGRRYGRTEWKRESQLRYWAIVIILLTLCVVVLGLL